jgi:hypothetical protein
VRGDLQGGCVTLCTLPSHRNCLSPLRWISQNLRQFHFDQSSPSNNIVVSTGILFKLSLQMTVQRAQCQTMTPAKLASPQSARSVRTCHLGDFGPTTTTNHHTSLSAHRISPSQQ